MKNIEDEFFVARYKTGVRQMPIAVGVALGAILASIPSHMRGVPLLWSTVVPAINLALTVFSFAYWLAYRKQVPSLEVIRYRSRLFEALLMLGGLSLVSSGVATFIYSPDLEARFLVIVQLVFFGFCIPPMIMLVFGRATYVYNVLLCGTSIVLALQLDFLAGFPLAAMIVVFALGLWASMRGDVQRFQNLIRAQVETSSLNSENARLAREDTLTGLPNRREFFAQLDEEIASGLKDDSRLVLGIVDLDGFKQVNDTYGHQIGDRVLHEVASRLRGEGPALTRFYRLGGDEFAFHMTTSESDVMLRRIGQSIIRLIERPIISGGNTVGVSASIGLVTFPGVANSRESLYEFADCALYQAKRSGRGRVEIFTPDQRETVNLETQVEQALRVADLDTEFYPEFQPIIDLGTGALRGFEVLARWRSASLGNVTPGTFIPVAERTGFVSQITVVMLRDCIKAMRQWRAPVCVSLNLSAYDVINELMIAKLIRQIEASGLTPDLFTFEVTETALIQDFSTASANLETLRRAGARVALDDFGTGYSSLSHLQALPLDVLKIDRSFVVDIETNVTSRTIVGSLLTMCHGLGIGCVAEGAETESQLQFLRALGCDAVQGFITGRPMGAEAVDAFIAERSVAVRAVA